jgi:peroxiredoxin
VLGVIQDELAEMGGRLLAVATDSPAQSLAVVEKSRLNFAILCDEDAELLRRFGVLHAGGGPRGRDIAIPAHFLLDRTGRVVWSHIAENVSDRPELTDLRAALRRLAESP